jgi:hypothetical protein
VRFELALVSHFQYDIEILKKTVLDKVIASLWVIAEGG